jgi:hypothetical protein
MLCDKEYFFRGHNYVGARRGDLQFIDRSTVVNLIKVGQDFEA